MATSGIAYAHFNNSSFKLESRWYAVGQNLEQNYTTVKVEAWFYAGSRINVSPKSLSIVFDTTPFTLTTPQINVSGGHWLKLGEATKNIYHKEDGTKGFDFYSSITIGSVSGLGNVGSASVLSNGVLNNIPKSSYLSASPSYSMFNKMALSISRSSANFTHEARIWVGNTGEGELIKVVKDITTSASVEMGVEENSAILRKMNTATSVLVNVIIVTFNNGIEIGYTNNYGTITAPSLSGTTWGGDFSTGSTISGVINKGWNTANITSTVQLRFGSQVFTIANKIDYTEWSYNTSLIEDALYTLAGNNASLSGVIRVYTYYNNVQVRSYAESNITAYMSNAKPIFSGTNVYYRDVASNIVSITGNNKYIVQGKSSVQVVLPLSDLAIGQKGATMKDYTVTLAGQKITKPHVNNDILFDFGLIHATSNQTLSVKARDSRGLEAEITKTVPIINYAQPNCNAKALRRSGFEETTNLSVGGVISPVFINGVSANAIQNVQYRWKVANGTFTSWTNFTRQTSLNSFTVTPVNLMFDETKTYIVEFGVQDKFGFHTIEKTVSEGVPIFFIDSDKRSVGVGKFPDRGALDVKGDVYVEGTVYAGFIKAGIQPNDLPEHTNLNNLNTKEYAGKHTCTTIAKALTIEGKPAGSNTAFVLEIEVHAGVKQTFTEYNNDNTFRMWVRNYYHYLGWSEWRRVLIENKMPYQAIGLYGGWVNYGGEYAPATYRKDEMGYVHITGAIKDGTTGTFIQFATLPVGFRPLYVESFSVPAGYGGTHASIDIKPNGIMEIRNGADKTITYLSGISFYAGI